VKPLKTNTMKTFLFTSVLTVLATIGLAQVSTVGNTSTQSADFVGWETGTNFDLTIEHEGDFNIDFFTDGTQKMIISSDGDVGIGTANPGYLLELDTGDFNLRDGIIRIGDNAVTELNGIRNVFIGVQADAAIAGGRDNTGIGDNAGQSITSADDNTCIGSNAGALISTGERNTIIGAEAGQVITTGNNNVALGFECLEATTTGDFNTGFGTGAGRALTSGECNTLIGNTAGSLIQTGVRNTVIGYSALDDMNGAQNDNTVIGARAGQIPVTGNSYTIIGADADAVTGLANATAIGYEAYVSTSNSLVLGGITGTNGGTNTNVGIGITNPTGRLHVRNNAQDINGHFVTTFEDMTDIIVAEYDESSTSDIDGIHVSLKTTSTSGAYDNVGVRSEVDAAFEDQRNYGFYSDVTGAVDFSYGIYSSATGANKSQYGGKFIGGTITDIGNNYGVWAEAKSTESGSSCTGGLFLSDGDDDGTTSTGVLGQADGATTCTGGSFTATDTYATHNFGVKGEATGGTNNYAVYGDVGSDDGDYAGYFRGDTYSTGQYQGSDRKLKSNIEELPDGLETVMALSPKVYDYNRESMPQMNLPKGQHFGFMADEVQKLLPTSVKSTLQPGKEINGNESESVEFLAVNYSSIIPFAVKAIQEQQEIIEQQSNELVEKEERISELEREVATLQDLATKVANMKEALEELAAVQNDATHHSVVADVPNSGPENKTELFQNRPNPFRADTEIRYTLGKEGHVDLSIYNVDGRLIINLVDTYETSGAHTIVWKNNDVPNGIYFYILSVDGVEYVKRAVRL
jgi:hypothetical protein